MIRFYNGRVMTFSDGVKISGDEVWTDGERIAYVGPEKPDRPAFEREIDLRGDLVMPSFKNAHTHSAMTFLRSYADDLPLNDWLCQQVFPMTPAVVFQANFPQGSGTYLKFTDSVLGSTYLCLSSRPGLYAA